MFSWLLSQENSIITEVMVLACLEVKSCLFIELVGYILVKLELFTKPRCDIGHTSFQVNLEKKKNRAGTTMVVALSAVFLYKELNSNSTVYG